MGPLDHPDLERRLAAQREIIETKLKKINIPIIINDIKKRQTESRKILLPPACSLIKNKDNGGNGSNGGEEDIDIDDELEEIVDDGDTEDSDCDD